MAKAKANDANKDSEKVEVKEDPKPLESAGVAPQDVTQVHQASLEDSVTVESVDVVSTPSLNENELEDLVDYDEVDDVEDVGTSVIAVPKNKFRYSPRAIGQHVICGNYAVGPEGVESEEPHDGLEPFVGWLLERVELN